MRMIKPRTSLNYNLPQSIQESLHLDPVSYKLSYWDELPSRPTAAILASVGRKERSIPMDITVLGIDLGKTVCSLAGIDSKVLICTQK